MVTNQGLKPDTSLNNDFSACYKLTSIPGEPNPVEIYLGTVDAGGYIGETCIFINESNEKAYLTIKAVTRCILYSIPIHDARTKLSKLITLHEWYNWVISAELLIRLAKYLVGCGGLSRALEENATRKRMGEI
jgi:hypothetical protein